jgi:hypothetical protein
MEVQNYEKDWIFTDDDCTQYVKPLSNDKFQLIEIRSTYNYERFVVVSDVIDVDFLLVRCLDKVEDVLHMYDYDSVDTVKELYGDQATQIIAKCIFEYHDEMPEYGGTRKDCERYIEQFIVEH